MQAFDFYREAWAAYVGVGLILLVFVYSGAKNWNWYLKFGLLSLLAVGAFTPDLIESSQTYAPLVITALLNAEVEGVDAIINGLLKLIIIWAIVLFSAMGLRRFFSRD